MPEFQDSNLTPSQLESPTSQTQMPQEATRRGFFDKLRNRNRANPTGPITQAPSLDSFGLVIPTTTLEPDSGSENETFKSLLAAKQITAKGALQIPEEVRKIWEEDPEYDKTMSGQLKFVQDIQLLVTSGQITQEQANTALAAVITEGKLASDIDDLTEILKRGALDRKLANSLGIARRGGKKFTIALGDLDKFKLINDTAGHAAGDAVLRSTSGYISSSIRRSSDIVGRYGGEEIVIGYPGADEEWSKANLIEMLAQMPGVVGDMVREMDFDLPNPITMSIGIAEFFDPTDTRSDEEIIAELYRIADSRMYLAKNNGRNQIVGSVEEQLILEKLESGPDASSGPTH